MKKFGGLMVAVLVGTALGLGACVTVGRDFPVDPVARLEIGTTTQTDVESWFGEPWRVGVEDGQRSWTYAIYRYSAIAPARTRDLVVRFDQTGVLRSFSFNSTDPSDAAKTGP